MFPGDGDDSRDVDDDSFPALILVFYQQFSSLVSSLRTFDATIAFFSAIPTPIKLCTIAGDSNADYVDIRRLQRSWLLLRYNASWHCS